MLSQEIVHEKGKNLQRGLHYRLPNKAKLRISNFFLIRATSKR
jgi:hypothetical protein